MRNRGGHKVFSLIETMIVMFLTATICFLLRGEIDGRDLENDFEVSTRKECFTERNFGVPKIGFGVERGCGGYFPSGASVSFRKVIPSRPRLVGNSPTEDPTNWKLDYLSGGHLATISYSQSGDKVVRQVGSESLGSGHPSQYIRRHTARWTSYGL